MSGNFLEISWAGLTYLYVLPVLFIFVAVRIFAVYKQKRVAHLLSATTQAKVLINFSHVKNIIKCVCMFLGLIFLFLALLRPQWDKKEEIIEQEGRDLL